MATISEIVWKQTSTGKCPQCGRNRPLGILNTVDDKDELCIDCYFGPPMEFWNRCEKGHLYVGDMGCDMCNTPKGDLNEQT